MKRTILIGADSTVHSANALRWAVDNFPLSEGNKLLLVHVEDLKEKRNDMQEKREFLSEMESYIKQCSSSAKANTNYEIRRIKGSDPAKELVNVGKTEKCKIVVVGEKNPLDSFGTKWGAVPLHLIQNYEGIVVVVRQMSLFAARQPLVEIYGAKTIFRDEKLLFEPTEFVPVSMTFENVSEESVLSPESSSEEEIEAVGKSPLKKKPSPIPAEKEAQHKLPEKESGKLPFIEDKVGKLPISDKVLEKPGQGRAMEKEEPSFGEKLKGPQKKAEREPLSEQVQVPTKPSKLEEDALGKPEETQQPVGAFLQHVPAKKEPELEHAELSKGKVPRIEAGKPEGLIADKDKAEMPEERKEETLIVPTPRIPKSEKMENPVSEFKIPEERKYEKEKPIPKTSAKDTERVQPLKEVKMPGDKSEQIQKEKSTPDYESPEKQKAKIPISKEEFGIPISKEEFGIPSKEHKEGKNLQDRFGKPKEKEAILGKPTEEITRKPSVEEIGSEQLYARPLEEFPHKMEPYFESAKPGEKLDMEIPRKIPDENFAGKVPSEDIEGIQKLEEGRLFDKTAQVPESQVVAAPISKWNKPFSINGNGITEEPSKPIPFIEKEIHYGKEPESAHMEEQLPPKKELPSEMIVAGKKQFPEYEQTAFPIGKEPIDKEAYLVEKPPLTEVSPTEKELKTDETLRPEKDIELQKAFPLKKPIADALTTRKEPISEEIYPTDKTSETKKMHPIQRESEVRVQPMEKELKDEEIHPAEKGFKEKEVHPVDEKIKIKGTFPAEKESHPKETQLFEKELESKKTYPTEKKPITKEELPTEKELKAIEPYSVKELKVENFHPTEKPEAKETYPAEQRPIVSEIHPIEEAPASKDIYPVEKNLEPKRTRPIDQELETEKLHPIHKEYKAEKDYQARQKPEVEGVSLAQKEIPPIEKDLKIKEAYPADKEFKAEGLLHPVKVKPDEKIAKNVPRDEKKEYPIGEKERFDKDLYLPTEKPEEKTISSPKEITKEMLRTIPKEVSKDRATIPFTEEMAEGTPVASIWEPKYNKDVLPGHVTVSGRELPISAEVSPDRIIAPVPKEILKIPDVISSTEGSRKERIATKLEEIPLGKREEISKFPTSAMEKETTLLTEELKDKGIPRNEELPTEIPSILKFSFNENVPKEVDSIAIPETMAENLPKKISSKPILPSKIPLYSHAPAVMPKEAEKESADILQSVFAKFKAPSKDFRIESPLPATLKEETDKAEQFPSKIPKVSSIGEAIPKEKEAGLSLESRIDTEYPEIPKFEEAFLPSIPKVPADESATKEFISLPEKEFIENKAIKAKYESMMSPKGEKEVKPSEQPPLLEEKFPYEQIITTEETSPLEYYQTVKPSDLPVHKEIPIAEPTSVEREEIPIFEPTPLEQKEEIPIAKSFPSKKSVEGVKPTFPTKTKDDLLEDKIENGKLSAGLQQPPSKKEVSISPLSSEKEFRSSELHPTESQKRAMVEPSAEGAIPIVEPISTFKQELSTKPVQEPTFATSIPYTAPQGSKSITKETGIEFPEVPTMIPLSSIQQAISQVQPEQTTKFGSELPEDTRRIKPQQEPIAAEALYEPSVAKPVSEFASATSKPSVTSIVKQYKEEPSLKEEIEETFERAFPSVPEESHPKEQKGFWQNIIEAIPLFNEKPTETPHSTIEHVTEVKDETPAIKKEAKTEGQHGEAKTEEQHDEAKHKKTFFKNLLDKKTAYSKVQHSHDGEADIVHENESEFVSIDKDFPNAGDELTKQSENADSVFQKDKVSDSSELPRFEASKIKLNVESIEKSSSQATEEKVSEGEHKRPSTLSVQDAAATEKSQSTLEVAVVSNDSKTKLDSSTSKTSVELEDTKKTFMSFKGASRKK